MLAFSSSEKEKIVVAIHTLELKTIIVGCFPKKKLKRNHKKFHKIKSNLIRFGAFFDDQNTFFLEIKTSNEKNFHNVFRCEPSKKLV